MAFLLFPETLLISIGVISSDHFYYATFISWLVYRAINLSISFSRRRFNPQEIFVPGNIFQFIWYVLCVALPIYISVFQPSVRPLPALPSSGSVNMAIVLIATSYFSASIGGIFYNSLRDLRQINISKTIDSLNETGLLALAKTAIVLGIIGVAFLTKNALGSSSINNAYSTYLVGSSSWSKLVSILLPPFLIYGVVLFGSLQVIQDRYRFIFGFPLLILVTLPLTLFRLNRAALFLPVFCYLAIFLRVKSKAKFVIIWGAILLIGGLAAFSLAEYRAKQIVTKGGQLSATAVGFQHNPSVITSIQNYLNAPQYLGYALEEIPSSNISLITPLKSIAAPLPKLSKWDADRTDGTSNLNLSISNIRDFDQVLSPIIESWISLGFIGLFVTFFMQGIFISILRRRFSESRNQFRRYFLLYTSIWISLFPCLSYLVLSQITFYVLMPPLLLLKLFVPNKTDGAPKRIKPESVR